MNEFEQKDYVGARSYADAVKVNADNIMSIFNDIDGVMDNLYNNNWQSSGADAARDRYNQIRSNYDVFYEKVVAMKNHIYNITAANEEADAAASQAISNI